MNRPSEKEEKLASFIMHNDKGDGVTWNELKEKLVLSRAEKREYQVVSSKRQKQEAAACLQAKRKVFTDDWQLNDALKELKRQRILLQDGKNRPWKYNRAFFDRHQAFEIARAITESSLTWTDWPNARNIHFFGFSPKDFPHNDGDVLTKILSQLNSAKVELGVLREKAIISETLRLFRTRFGLGNKTRLSKETIQALDCLGALLKLEISSLYTETADTILKIKGRRTIGDEMRRTLMALGLSSQLTTFFNKLENETNENAAQAKFFSEVRSIFASEVQSYESVLNKDDMDFLRRLASEHVKAVHSPLLIVIE